MPLVIHIVPLTRDRHLADCAATIRRLLPALQQQFPKLTLQILEAQTEEQLIERLETAKETPGNDRFVVVSDALVQPSYDLSEDYEPVAWVKELIADSYQAVSVAIVFEAERILDIDRVVKNPYSEAALRTALQKAIEKIEYLSPPQDRLEIHPQRIKARLLANNSELDQYFRLRHQVYSIMGYLEVEVEHCPSRLEIDNADSRALHFGIFVSTKNGEFLAGTTRIVTNRAATDHMLINLETLARNDPVILRRIKHALPLQLPVFQSQHAANSVINEILEQDIICGELSRVIVAPRFRGAALSEKLVNYAIQAAEIRGVQRLFLECLPIHVSFYEKKCGFRISPGMVGQVIGVQRTMGVMERCMSGALPGELTTAQAG